jgi:hypothetical protein
MIEITRRSLITGLVAAPAIVRAGSLMPVKQMHPILVLPPRMLLPEIKWRMLNEAPPPTAAAYYSPQAMWDRALRDRLGDVEFSRWAAAE